MARLILGLEKRRYGMLGWPLRAASQIARRREEQALHFLLIDFLLRTAAFAISVMVASKVLPGVHVRSFGSALVVALVYAFFNFIAYYLFAPVTWSFALLTFGLGIWIVNTILLVLTDKVVDSFRIDGLFWAAMASLLISLVDWLINLFLPIGRHHHHLTIWW